MNNKRMIYRALISLAMVCLMAASMALAQTTAPTATQNTEQNTAQNTAPPATSSDSNDQTPPDNPWYANSDGAYTVSLGTGALISLYPQVRSDQTISNGEYAEGVQPPSSRQNYRYQFFYGGTVSSVYTNNVGNPLPGASSELYSTSIQPYVAVFMPTHTGRFLVQYSGIVNPNDTGSGGPQAYHTVTLSAMGSLSERWFWSASSSGSYGSESARLQGPLSFLVVQATPIADTTSDAVLLRAANVAFVEDRVGFGWLKSRRDRITFTGFHTYTGIQDQGANAIGSHANAVGTKVEYTRSMTQRIDLRSYGEADTVLNGPTCNTYGGGLGLGIKMSHSLVLDVEGGPQWSSSTCGSPQSANFAASLVKNFGSRDRIYASANRMFTTVAQLDSRWEDNATVGFTKGIQRLTFTADAGYLRGTSIVPITPAYHGFFVAPRARFKITNVLGLTAGYRDFQGSGGNLVSGRVNYATVGLEFYPAPIRFW